MTFARQSQTATLGLFEKRFDGDESLMALAQRRFQQAGMGMEIHAGTSGDLKRLLSLRPWPEAPVVVHLPRDLDLLQDDTINRLIELASCAAGQVIGCVLHDQRAIVDQPAEYLRNVRQLAGRLEKITAAPLLFVEYAVGLDPGAFVQFWESTSDVSKVAPCIDIGHVGIRAARSAYADKHKGQDICALKAQGAELPRLMPDVQEAVNVGFRTVVQLVKDVVACSKNKRLHFHLHDGHPLSTFSPFGVADHLSFFGEIPLRFEYGGQRFVPPMFGPEGLAQVLEPALKNIGPERLSLALEIHPTGGRLPLGDADDLFGHWRDLTNAELTNHWLDTLTRNHALLLGTIERVLEKNRIRAASR
jgi:hypothetical protein